MLLEVYRDNVRLWYTTEKECIPPIEVIKSIKASKHKILLDGKVYKITKGKQDE